MVRWIKKRLFPKGNLASRYKKDLPEFKEMNKSLPKDFSLEKVRIEIYEDVEVENRGFQLDIILAFYEKIPLGYHAISCIPKENIELFIPDYGEYAKLIRGQKEVILPYSKNQIKEYNEFLEYHVDAPITDFIRVYDKYQHRGIGGLLMQAGIDFSVKKYKKFYFSSITTEDSERLFSKFKRRYNLSISVGRGYYQVKGKERFYINFNNC